MTDTPRTDAKAFDADLVSASFARELERENEYAGEYYVAYTLKDGPPIMNFDAFKTHELAQEFIHKLNESRRAFSVAGVLRFSLPNVQAQR